MIAINSSKLLCPKEQLLRLALEQQERRFLEFRAIGIALLWLSRNRAMKDWLLDWLQTESPGSKEDVPPKEVEH